MAYNRYQYGTSPRKLQPEYEPIQKKYPKKSTARKMNPKKSKKVAKQTKKEHTKMIMYLFAAFAILFAISYRNSIIDENFKQTQELKTELSTIQKENEQLEVSIESSLNLKNIEEVAKNELGMEKLDSSKTRYISLPREDYVEPATEEIIMQEETSWIEEIWNWITSLV